MSVYRAGFEGIRDVDQDLLVKVGNGLAAYNQSIENGEVLPPRHRGVYFAQERNRMFGYCLSLNFIAISAGFGGIVRDEVRYGWAGGQVAVYLTIISVNRRVDHRPKHSQARCCLASRSLHR